MSKKSLEITLVTTSEDTFDVEIYEPESGEFLRVHCQDKGNTVNEENQKIINEIRSWVSIIRENEERVGEEVRKNDEPRQINQKMICKECGSDMYLDDQDYNFKGNYNNYWNCEKDDCLTSCIEQVRFGQSFKEEWHSENNNEVKDYVVKHNIKRENASNKPLDNVIKTCEEMSKNSNEKTETGRIDKER